MAEHGNYWGELRANWRVLLAASLGMAVGLSLFSYVTSIFAPFLIKEFHWERAQFARIGYTMLAAILVSPLAGHLVDRFGVRAMALTGVILLPMVLLAYTQQSGSFGYYFACSAGMMIVGSLTGPVTYTRLIIERFSRARGLALTIVMSAPAISGIVFPRLITSFIEANGWKLGYAGLAGMTLVLGLIAIALFPAGSGLAPVRKTMALGAPAGAFREVLKTPVFWILFIAVFLTTIHTPLHGSQFVLLLKEQGLTSLTAATMLMVYSAGTVIGRIVCGLALDHYPARIVAAISMSLPAAGLALLASPFDSLGVVGLSVLLVGITVGAEGDLLSFLVGRYFRIEIFSRALALCYCGLFAASISGVALVSYMLKTYDSYAPFLWIAAGCVVVGSFLFLRLPAATPPAKGEA